ncbi:MAG: TPR repeat-containing protein YfgC precursor [Syntrophorhabdus sp. PtaU1.Bin002]|nr:MAG: TPR repeat-containing protein YfgC precursor [Syntrophorhabdus sp. PtaU1.Bin002]
MGRWAKVCDMQAALAVLFIFLALSAIVGCAVNPVTGRSELMLVSEGQEVQMGKELYPNALWGAEGGGGEYREERLKAYLKDIVLNIQRVSHRPDLPTSFAIQNSSIPNAWAIPGHVVMTRGLLAGLDNEAEFAYVMGHEIGHVSARHSARQMSYGMVSQLLLAGGGMALGGGTASNLAMSLGSIGSNLVLLKYSRADELEADRLGVQYMAKLGYNPKNAVGAQANVERIANEYLRSVGQSSEEKGFFQDMLSSHPRTSTRLSEMQGIIGATPMTSIRGDGTNRSRFQANIAGLKATNQAYHNYYDKAVRALKKGNTEEANALISRGISSDPQQASFHALRGFIMLDRKSYGEAERDFNSALRLDSNYQPAYRGLGILNYARNDYGQGINYLTASLSLFPNDLSSHYFLGMSHYKRREYRSAISHLKPVADARPKHPTVHGVLGQCYENVNDPQSAYSQYVLQTQVDAKSEIGRQSSSRAEALKPSIQRVRPGR